MNHEQQQQYEERLQETDVSEGSVSSGPNNKSYASGSGTDSIVGEKKIIYLIRHAESEENVKLARLMSAGRSLRQLRLPDKSDATDSLKLVGGVFAGRNDEPLSEFGRRQGEEMGQQLKKQDFLKKEQIRLVVHSPLVRARDTCKAMLGCWGEEVRDEDNFPADEGPSLPSCVKRVLQLECLREATPWEQVTGTKKGVATRLAEFEKWLDDQPEDRIAVVGHSQYFMVMLGMNEKFRNCDVWRADFAYEESNRWTGMTLLHRHNEEELTNERSSEDSSSNSCETR